MLFLTGPQNEARAGGDCGSQTRDSQPIRYGVITHHHFHHTSGLLAVVAEGITIVTPEVNKKFSDDIALSAAHAGAGFTVEIGQEAAIEGFKGDKRVFQDATRTLQAHVIKGIFRTRMDRDRASRREKILGHADTIDPPPANDPAPNPPVVGTMASLDNIARLNLAPERVMSIHNRLTDRSGNEGVAGQERATNRAEIKTYNETCVTGRRQNLR